MSAEDTIFALHEGLITAAEAAEQLMVERLDEAFEKAAAERDGHVRPAVRRLGHPIAP